MSLQVRIAMPEVASLGEDIEIKTLVAHPMESGFRLDGRGEAIPKKILQKFTCTYNGVLVFETVFGPGIAANPFTTFYLQAAASGEVVFEWLDENGDTTRIVKNLKVN